MLRNGLGRYEHALWKIRKPKGISGWLSVRHDCALLDHAGLGGGREGARNANLGGCPAGTRIAMRQCRAVAFVKLASSFLESADASIPFIGPSDWFACPRIRRHEPTTRNRPKIVRVPHDGNRTCVAFSPDGKTLATGGRDNCIRLWDVGTAKLKLAIPAHSAQAGVSRLAFFPDGKTLASASWAGDGTVKLWEVAGGKQLQVVGMDEGGIGFLAVSPDGNFLAWGGKIHLYEVQARREARCLSPPGAVDSVAFSPDSKLLASANGGATVRSGDVAGGRSRSATCRQGQYHWPPARQAIAFSGDGNTMATAGPGKCGSGRPPRGTNWPALGAADERFFASPSPRMGVCWQAGLTKHCTFGTS